MSREISLHFRSIAPVKQPSLTPQEGGCRLAGFNNSFFPWLWWVQLHLQIVCVVTLHYPPLAQQLVQKPSLCTASVEGCSSGNVRSHLFSHSATNLPLKAPLGLHTQNLITPFGSASLSSILLQPSLLFSNASPSREETLEAANSSPHTHKAHAFILADAAEMTVCWGPGQDSSATPHSYLQWRLMFTVMW